jgi:hypothetical protein
MFSSEVFRLQDSYPQLWGFSCCESVECLTEQLFVLVFGETSFQL